MYHFDSDDSSLVFDGIEKGIADSPFLGISDMRNVNITSVPGEGSVNFATQVNSYGAIPSGIVVSADSSTEYITYTGAGSLISGMAVVFAGGSLPPGITAGTIYWASSVGGAGAGTFQIYSDVALNNVVNITGTGTGTFTIPIMAKPKYGVHDTIADAYWLIDSSGQVWSNTLTTSGGFWVFMGNRVNNFSNGNGIVFYAATDGGTNLPVGYIFIFSNGSIDYTKSANGIINWQYGWNPNDGTAAGYSATPTQRLKTRSGQNYDHEALLAPDNEVYYCDSNWVGRFYQLSATTLFDPATTSTYVFDNTQLLPGTDRANCLTFLGNNILVGGVGNVIYPWDRFSSLPSFQLLLPEYNVAKMVTVNTNTYIFMGNRGRIYTTNGTNVVLYKKIPDHISGTIEPYFTWGGVGSVKNQLYFGVKATSNSSAAINQYGGLWSINLDNGAIRLVNKLSYGTYAGLASLVLPITGAGALGTGVYIGWDSGAATFGVDNFSGSPYVGGESTIDFDLVPIGTFNHPQNFTTIEYKLTRPLVAGESITLKTRLIFNTSDTGYQATLTDNTVGNYSSSASINFKNAQWLQLQAVLTSAVSSPSYVRLKEIRISGVTGTQPNQLSL